MTRSMAVNCINRLLINVLSKFVAKETYLLKTRFMLWINIIQTIIAAFAAIIGVWWWFCRRERKPIAQIGLKVAGFGLSSGECYLRVETRIRNIGKVLLKTGDVTIYVQQVDPIPEVDGELPAITWEDGSFDWPFIFVHIIEGNDQYEPMEEGVVPAYERKMTSLPKVVLAVC